MNQSILEALMQLFAIVAHSASENSKGKVVVERYLSKQLSKQQINEYLEKFDSYINALHAEKGGKKEGKQLSSNSVKILKICTKINEELTHPQKLIVCLRLIEFLKANKTDLKIASEFAETVAETFNINKKEFILIYGLVFQIKELLNNDNLLIVGNIDNSLQRARNIACKTFDESDSIYIVHIKSVDFFLLSFRHSDAVLLNGQEIVDESIHIVGSGAIIKIPKYGSLYHSDIFKIFRHQSEHSAIYFQAKQIEYSFRNGVKGLHKLSFNSESGKMLGIMGGSGAGKSTLLQILNGNAKPEKGEVTINGRCIHGGKHARKYIGYVSQDDLLIDELSVFDNLFFAARLSYPTLEKDALIEKVDTCLLALGLYEVKHLKVGNPMDKLISGGQRKRLNIALEYIREPEILFVDEPTSGLSSRDSERIMELLKQMALSGKLVFVVIHQPSSSIFKLFDQLLLLDQGGYPIYFGYPLEAAAYFKETIQQASAQELECNACGNVNPEQLFDIIEQKVVDEYGRPTSERKISPEEWYLFFKREGAGKDQKVDAAINSNQKKSTSPSRLLQYIVFFQRDLKSKLANKQYLLINILEAPFLSFVLSLFLRSWDTSKAQAYTFFYNANLPAYLLICVIAALFIGLTVSAEEIFKDKKIRKREKFLTLSNFSYLAAKVTLLFILSAFQALLFVSIGNTILGIEGMHTPYWLVMFSTLCFANILGLNISATFNSAVTIYILIPLLIIPQLLLSGIIVKFEHLNPNFTSEEKIPVAAELMASRWAFEALAVNQFINNQYEKPFYSLHQQKFSSSWHQQYWLDAFFQACEKMKSAEKTADQPNQILNKYLKQVPYFKGMPVWKGKDDAAIADYISYAEQFSSFLNKFNAEITNKIDSKIRENAALIEELRNKHANQALEKLVRASDRTKKIMLSEEAIVQLADPVYRIPGQQLVAHHYAPYKRIGNTLIETLYFNVIVIWLMSLMLFILLYFDGLKRMLNIKNS
jgi:ABC-type multidrug transport system ATPase subunit